MKVRYLKYVGKRPTGKLIIKKAHAASVWRNFEYSQGMRLRLGEEIPEKIAVYIVDSYPKSFHLETENLPALPAFKDQFNLLVNGYAGDLTISEMSTAAFQELLLTATDTKRLNSDKYLKDLLTEIIKGAKSMSTLDKTSKILKTIFQELRKKEEKAVPQEVRKDEEKNAGKIQTTGNEKVNV